MGCTPGMWTRTRRLRKRDSTFECASRESAGSEVLESGSVLWQYELHGIAALSDPPLLVTGVFLPSLSDVGEGD